MKERLREKIRPIQVMANDVIELSYDDGTKQTVVAKDTIGREMTLSEAVIFDVEKGDFGEDTIDGIGGAFLAVRRRKKAPGKVLK